jgi:thiol-disulfide isomerase/thioredoxin
LLGREPCVLFFWATWCTVCKAAIPELLQMQQRLHVAVVAITQEPSWVVKRFLSQWHEPFPEIVALDGEGQVHAALEVSGYPTFLHVDGGQVRRRSVGYDPDRGLDIEGWKPDSLSRH